jgi:M6 family metalloprotease-like protein
MFRSAAAPHDHRIFPGPRAGRRRPWRTVVLATAAALATSSPAIPTAGGATLTGMRGPCAVEHGAGFDEGPMTSNFVQPRGNRKATMVMADFPDLPAATPAADRARFFADYGDSYFRRASYGRYRLSLEPTPGWVRMPRPWSSYRVARGNDDRVARDYVQDAVDAAARQRGTGFSGTDLVLVVADGNVPAPPDVSQANLFTGLRAGGHRVPAAALVFGRHQDSPLWQRGNFVHEANHLYGLPDLYNVGNAASVEYAGGWDTMSMAGLSDLLGWHKWKLGWIGAREVDCVTRDGTSDHTLSPVGSSRSTRITAVRTGPHSAVVAEARARRGLDRDICAEGVLLYTVDSRTPTGSGPVRVADARPRSGGGRACSDQTPAELAELSDAPFRPGQAHTFPGGVRVAVTGTADDGGYRIRVTNAREP